MRLKTRYAKFWDLVYMGKTSLTLEEFKTCLKTRPLVMYYQVKYPEEIHFLSDRGYLYTSVLDDALHGMPVLNTGYPFA